MIHRTSTSYYHRPGADPKASICELLSDFSAISEAHHLLPLAGIALIGDDSGASRDG